VVMLDIFIFFGILGAMKLVHLKKSSKLIGVTLVVALSAGAVTTYAMLNQHPQTPVVKHSVQQVAPVTQDTTTVPKEEAKPEKAAVSPTTQSAAEPAPEPVPVKTSMEIANEYPQLVGSEASISCLNTIFSKYPERFTEDVREQNVRALRAFATPCTTGVTTEHGNYLDMSSGQVGHGIWFDSALAVSYR
jgi:hypothetical protein